MGSIRTFFVFLDLPVHVEFRVSDMPILEKGLEFEIRAKLTNPNDSRKVRVIDGEMYEVKDRKLIYSTIDQTKMGFTQYIELDRVRLKK